MVLEDFPDTLLNLVVAKLGLVDNTALSCTCRRLHRQAAVNDSPGQQQQQQVALLAAAARQRLQVAVQGGWRDELLLAAWQQRQLMAAAEDASKQRSSSINKRPSTDRCGSNHDLLHCGLGLNFIEAAGNQGLAQQQTINFSGFLVPGSAVLDASRHFITDGFASAFIRGNTVASSSSSSSSCSSALATAAEGAQHSSDTREVHPLLQTQRPHQPEQQSHPACVPSYERSILSDAMQLFKGHLPPQTLYGALRSYNRSIGGAAQHLTCESGNPVADVLRNVVGDSPQGVEQLTNFCGHYYMHDRNLRRQHLINKLAGFAAESDVSSSSAAHKPVQLLQLLMLPTPPPAGSIADLNHPWPPQLQPGALSSVDARGLESDPVLRMAVTGQEPAAVFRGAKTAYANVPADFLPDSFHTTVKHLDLSGVPWSTAPEKQLLKMVVGCRQLKSLSLAGTSASHYMFEALTDSTTAGSTTSTLFMANPSCSRVCRSVDAASSANSHLDAAHRQQQRRGNASTERAAVAYKPAYAGLKQCQTEPFTASKPMLAAVAAVDAVAGLLVLDVSGCKALQSADAGDPVFVAFRQLLGSLSCLRVLLSCRTNVDAILQASGPVHKPQLLETPAAAAGTVPSQPQFTSSTTLKELKSADSSVLAEVQQSAPEAVYQAARLRAVLGSLAELDTSYATSLSAECMADLLTTCTQLKRLGVVGCKTLAAQGGTEKLREALRSLQRQQQQQQSLSSSTLGSSALVPLAPLTDQLYSGMAALDLQNHQHEQYPSQDRAEAQSAPQQIHQDNQPCQRLLRPQQQTPQSGESCSSTTRPTADGLCHRNDLAQPVGVSLPKLTQLSVGWGWSSASIAALLLQSDCLTSFNAGVGACVTDSLLATLADCCPHLQRLKLSLCPISSKGIGPVLASCPKLTSLQLQQCVGSFNMQELLQHKLQQQHSWQLSTLQLDGPSVYCSDEQLLQLIGISQQQHAAETPSAPLRPAKCWQAITNLCLVRMIGLTDGLLHQLAAAGCQLQHLRLEECFSSSSSPAGSCAPLQQEQQSGVLGAMSTRSDSSVRSVLTTSFSQAALLRLLSQSCSLTLRSLQIRHAVAPVAVDFVELAVAAAPLLQRLVLDACDLLGKGLLVPETQAAGSHAALQALHVVRCQELSEEVTTEEQQHAYANSVNLALSVDHWPPYRHNHQHQQGQLLNAEPMDSSGQMHPAVSCHSCGQGTGGRTAFRRRRDKELKVQLLQVGRSLHLPP